MRGGDRAGAFKTYDDWRAATATLVPAAISYADEQRQPAALRRAIDLRASAREHGNQPFGALLVDAKGNVVLEAENTVRTDKDVTAHAETNLMRVAIARFDRDFLGHCTLYTRPEPCAIVRGHWGSIRSLVFGFSQEQIPP